MRTMPDRQGQWFGQDARVTVTFLNEPNKNGTVTRVYDGWLGLQAEIRTDDGGRAVRQSDELVLLP